MKPNEKEPMNLLWAFALNAIAFFGALTLLVVLAIGSYAAVREMWRAVF